MNPDDRQPDGGQEVRSAMEVFSRDARLDARMLKEETPITDAQRKALIRDLNSYRESHKQGGKPLSWSKLAEYVGVGATVLNQTAKGTYEGDVDRILRMVDAFLSREEQQAKRPDVRGFQKIKLTEYIIAAINQAVVRHSIGVITGEPGDGKSKHAEWYRDNHEGVVLITCDDADCDAKFVIDELHKALKLGTFNPSVRGKKREIEAWLQAHKHMVIMVDEAQKLTNAALEMLRALHDKSDPEGRRNVPVILFGDEDFYKVILRSRGGDRTPISPQITSRMYPVVSLDHQALERDSDGEPIEGTTYTKDDIDRIIKNQRLRIVRPDALAWVTRLANLHRHGRLRQAIKVLEIAIDIKTGGQVTIDDLRAALEMFIGPAEAKVVVDEMEVSEPRAARAAG